jgi:hypothetical protein
MYRKDGVDTLPEMMDSYTHVPHARDILLLSAVPTPYFDLERSREETPLNWSDESFYLSFEYRPCGL